MKLKTMNQMMSMKKLNKNNQKPGSLIREVKDPVAQKPPKISDNFTKLY